jgi:aromatic-L-amino-acid/L-tryptophan decarboxylase
MRDWTRDEIRRIGHLVVDLIADHVSSLPDRPVFQPVPAALARQLLDTPAPESPREPEEILRLFKDTIEPYPFGNGHPRFWGWVNSPPAVMGIFADALAAAMNPSCAGGNHAAVYVERQLLGWFRDLVGFPESSMGLLVSGGSMATMTGLAVARHVKSGVDVRTSGLRDAPRPFAFYMTAEGHSCARMRPSRWTSMPCGRRFRPIAHPVCSRLRSSRQPGRPIPAPSTISIGSPMSATSTASGCMSTRRTAGRRS